MVTDQSSHTSFYVRALQLSQLFFCGIYWAECTWDYMYLLCSTGMLARWATSSPTCATQLRPRLGTRFVMKKVQLRLCQGLSQLRLWYVQCVCVEGAGQEGSVCMWVCTHMIVFFCACIHVWVSKQGFHIGLCIHVCVCVCLFLCLCLYLCLYVCLLWTGVFNFLYWIFCLFWASQESV